MVTPFQFKHGTAAQLKEYVGKDREIIIEDESRRPHVMDGKTKGGHAVALFSDIPEVPDTSALTTEIQSIRAAIITVCNEVAKGN